MPSADSSRASASASSSTVTAADHRIAAELATEAGELLLRLRESEGPRLTPKALGRAGDEAAHKLLVRRLAELRPADAVLSEEGRNDLARLSAPRVWIVDPLDGTREFSDVPRSDWAVHVALVVEGVAVAGAVALPAEGLTFASDPPPPLPPPVDRAPLVVVSRSRPPLEAQWIANELDGEMVALGSAGAKAMAVVRGDVDVYPHSGGQYEWDSAAPVAVARAAGLHVSRLDGAPLVYNRADPYLPDLLICRPELADRAIQAAMH